MAVTNRSWSRLTAFLLSEAERSTVLSFQQIERIIEHALPASAYNHPAFWSNTSSYSRAWRDAGREVSRRGLLPENVRFTQVRLSTGAVPARGAPTLRIVREIETVQPAAVDAAKVIGSGQVLEVLLLGLGKGRVRSPEQVKDTDVPDLFGRRRRYAEQRGLPWFILSPDYGLLRPNALVAPDEVLLKAQPAGYRRAWGAWVVERLRRELGQLAGTQLDVHAADPYADALMEPALAAGATLTRPLKGLRQGEQLAWYIAHSGSADG